MDHNSAFALFGKIFGWLAWYESPDSKFFNVVDVFLFLGTEAEFLSPMGVLKDNIF